MESTYSWLVSVKCMCRKLLSWFLHCLHIWLFSQRKIRLHFVVVFFLSPGKDFVILGFLKNNAIFLFYFVSYLLKCDLNIINLHVCLSVHMSVCKLTWSVTSNLYKVQCSHLVCTFLNHVIL